MKNIIILIFLCLAVTLNAQPPTVIAVNVDDCSDSGGSIEIVTTADSDIDRFTLEKQAGPDPNNFVEVDPEYTNTETKLFENLDVGLYRVSGLDVHGCTWCGSEYQNNATAEEYQTCLIPIRNSRGLYLRDCPNDTGLEPSSIDCGWNIWWSPSIQNCYKNQGGEPEDNPPGSNFIYELTSTWDCDFTQTGTYTENPVYQLYQNGSEPIEQYANKMNVTIHNTSCEDFVVSPQTNGRILSPFWTFARTDETIPDDWYMDHVNVGGNIYMLGNCFELYLDNYPPTIDGDYINNFNPDEDCIRIGLNAAIEAKGGVIPAGGSFDLEIPWHPPIHLSTSDIPESIIPNADWNSAVNTEPQFCILLQIIGNENEGALQDIRDLDANLGSVKSFVENHKELATHNLVLTDGFKTLNDLSQGTLNTLTPLSSPNPLPEVNEFQVYPGDYEPVPAAPTSTIPTVASDLETIKVVMVNNALTAEANIDIRFDETVPNGEDMTEFGDLYMYPDKDLWAKIVDAGYAGEGFIVHDEVKNILKLTSGNGFRIDNLEYDAKEKRYIGFRFEENTSKKPYEANQVLTFRHHLNHFARYTNRFGKAVSKDSNSGVDFATMVTTVSKTQPLFIEGLSITPNPTSGLTTFSFNIEKESEVTIRLMDSQGRLVSIIQGNNKMETGFHSIDFNANVLANGIYFVQLSIDGNNHTEKMIVGK